MFNKEYVASVMDIYQCNQLVVCREGFVYALRPEGQMKIPGLMFDTHTADGELCSDAILKAQTSSGENYFG